MDVGNVGVTYTNAGFLGRANVRNNPAGPPSFEYPLNSGVEHLFEAGLWIGAFRSDGLQTVRTGSITSSSGYRAGAVGYEFAQLAPFTRRSTLPESPYYLPGATSHLDLLTAFTDTARFVPGTFTPYPTYGERLGAVVEQRAYGYNFPFAEYFTIVEFYIVNTSAAKWDSVYVGLYHNLIVRNVNTTTDAGTAFFNKAGLGAIDSLQTSYAFNAGGTEEGVNTYGAVTYLGGEWRDPRTRQTRFMHPNTADRIAAAGYPRPFYNPRWWLFSSTDPDLARPQDDVQSYEKMALPYPQRSRFASEAEYQAAFNTFRTRLRTDGLQQQGNWIGLSSFGPFSEVLPGDTVKVAFALVAARKPENLQQISDRPVDTPESRAILASNVGWARRTWAGEDVNLDGILSPGEDRNGNGRLDRFLIPEPPRSPKVRVELDAGQVTLYWDASAETSVDPVTGRSDFEGYRIYRSNAGDDRSGDLFAQIGLFAQYDRQGNRTGYNNGFQEVRLATPKTFDGDTTKYVYKLTVPGLLSGWQYAFAVTAFDEGDQTAGLPPFESSRVANAVRVFPGAAATASGEVGVYPNPYRVNAAWDGGTNRTRKLYFTNLPARCEITVYTPAGEVVDRFEHDAATYQGEGRWYDQFAGSGQRVAAGGEHAWDILSTANLNLSTGLYLFSVRDLDGGAVKTGRFVVIK